MTILEEIILYKQFEVKNLKAQKRIRDLEQTPYFERQCISLRENLLNESKTGIIAEFKRKSPSKGIINDTAKVEDVTKAYCQDGASGLSILTDEKYFGGNIEDILSVRNSIECPILRKDFMVEEFQVLEAKSIGADVILLIAAALDTKHLFILAKLAKSLGLEVLLEVHNEMELLKINQYVDIIGVNNRNLKTFEVNVNTSIELSAQIPIDFLKISESGISKTETIRDLKNVGYQGFLIGENFMKTENPSEEFKKFIEEL